MNSLTVGFCHRREKLNAQQRLATRILAAEEAEEHGAEAKAKINMGLVHSRSF